MLRLLHVLGYYMPCALSHAPGYDRITKMSALDAEETGIKLCP
jgi:hypothetical protein